MPEIITKNFQFEFIFTPTLAGEFRSFTKYRLRIHQEDGKLFIKTEITTRDTRLIDAGDGPYASFNTGISSIIDGLQKRLLITWSYFVFKRQAMIKRCAASGQTLQVESAAKQNIAWKNTFAANFLKSRLINACTKTGFMG